MSGVGARIAVLAITVSVAVSALVPVAAGATVAGADVYRAYAIATASGMVGTFGGAGFHGDLATDPPSSPVVGLAATADRRGYWLVERDGTVRAYGDAPVAAGAVAGPRTVGIALDAVTGGFYTATASGVIRNVDAPSRAPVRVPAGDGSVVGLAGSDGGVWLVTAGGDVLSSGPVAPVVPPAAIRGVVGMVATGDGRGYWLVTAGGRLLAAGDALRMGPATDGSSPAVAFVPTPDGRGGLVLRSDGSAAALGDATVAGDAASPLHPPLYPRAYQLPPTGAVGGAYLAAGPQRSDTGPWRVTFLGDSLSVILGRYTRDYVENHHLATWVSIGGILGCGVVGDLPLADYSSHGPLAATLPACGRWAQQYRRELALSHPDVVVLLLGFWESQRHRLAHDGVVTVRTSAAFRDYIADQLAQVRQLVADSGARLIVLPAPYYGDGTPRANVEAFNALLPGAFPGAAGLDLTTMLDPYGEFATTVEGVRVRTADRVHLTKAGVQRVIDPALVPLIVREARTARSSTSGTRSS